MKNILTEKKYWRKILKEYKILIVILWVKKMKIIIIIMIWKKIIKILKIILKEKII